MNGTDEEINAEIDRIKGRVDYLDRSELVTRVNDLVAELRRRHPVQGKFDQYLVKSHFLTCCLCRLWNILAPSQSKLSNMFVNSHLRVIVTVSYFLSIIDVQFTFL
jgi:hypothetical protein